MNIALILEGPLGFDGKNYLTSEGEGIYIDGIAEFFNDITLCAYVFRKRDPDFNTVCNYKFESHNIKIIELPHKKSGTTGFFSKIIHFVDVFKIILEHIKQWDIIYIFLPGFPGAFTYLINIFSRKKYILYLASDWPEEAELLFPWNGYKNKLLLPFFKFFAGWVERKAVQNSFLTITAGRATYEKYNKTGVPIYETIPRLNWKDLKVYNRSNTCLSKQIKLLYVGYLLPRKGIMHLLEALCLLQDIKDINITLIIAGSGIQEQELKEYIQKLNISRHVKLLGHIPNKAVYKYFRECDIFILPTYSGEGFPRVLYEAMSQCIPIITTGVCGIPYKMKHEENCLIIEPKSSTDIAAAVKRLINDKPLRKKIIQSGRRFIQDLIASNSENQVYSLYKKHYPGTIK